MSWLGRIFGPPREPPPARGDPERVAQVRAVLEELRPMFAADGGAVELVAVEEGWVVLRMEGACTGCHAIGMTLEGAVEPRLRAALPWVQGVRAE